MTQGSGSSKLTEILSRFIEKFAEETSPIQDQGNKEEGSDNNGGNEYLNAGSSVSCVEVLPCRCQCNDVRSELLKIQRQIMEIEKNMVQKSVNIEPSSVEQKNNEGLVKENESLHEQVNSLSARNLKLESIIKELKMIRQVS